MTGWSAHPCSHQPHSHGDLASHPAITAAAHEPSTPSMLHNSQPSTLPPSHTTGSGSTPVQTHQRTHCCLHHPPAMPRTPRNAVTVRPSSPYSQRGSSSPFATQASFQDCVKSSRMIIWMTRNSALPKRAAQPACRTKHKKAHRGVRRQSGRSQCGGESLCSRTAKAAAPH